MLRIDICDDMSDHLEIIKKSAEQYAAVKRLSIDIRCFDSSMDYLDKLESEGSAEIVLLDICMPAISGTDIAREIRRRNDTCEIIFLTSSNDYAVDAFALRAAHYLLKPFTQNEFDEAMDRAAEHFDADNEKYFTARSEGGEIHRLQLNRIQYIESRAHEQTVFFDNGSTLHLRLSLASLSSEFEKAAPGQFMMPYKGYMVNIRAIAAIEAARIIMRSGAEIPLPRGSFRNMKAAFFNYMFDRNK